MADTSREAEVTCEDRSGHMSWATPGRRCGRRCPLPDGARRYGLASGVRIQHSRLRAMTQGSGTAGPW